jgi:hypothetical protein
MREGIGALADEIRRVVRAIPRVGAPEVALIISTSAQDLLSVVNTDVIQERGLILRGCLSNL